MIKLAENVLSKVDISVPRIYLKRLILTQDVMAILLSASRYLFLFSAFYLNTISG